MKEGSAMQRVVPIAVALVALLSCAAVAGWQWVQTYDTVYSFQRWSGDYDWWNITLDGGTQYKFVMSVPWNADYDMKLFYDYDGDGEVTDAPYNSRARHGTSGHGERVAQATSIDRPEVLIFTPQWSGSFKLKTYSFLGSGDYSLRVYEWQYRR